MNAPDPGKCTSCHAPVLWGIHLGTGKKHPCDPRATATTGTRFVWDETGNGWRSAKGDQIGHVSHFFSCPNAAHHRRKR